jgi:hypothetical protein
MTETKKNGAGSTALTHISQQQIAALDEFAAGADVIKAERPMAIGIPLLKLNRGSGLWNHGQAEVQVEKDSRWIANPLVCGHGWINWPRVGTPNAGKKNGEQMVGIGKPMPDMMTLPHFTDGDWTKQIAIGFACLTGVDKGLGVMFKSNAGGGVERGEELILKIRQQWTNERGKPDPQICPVVTLSSDWYMNKSTGTKVYKPVFTIVGWQGLGAASEPAAAANPAPAQEAEPQPQPGVNTRRSRSARTAA